MNYKSSTKPDEYFWQENFENFSKVDASRYDCGVSSYPFNTELYDGLLIPEVDAVLEKIPGGKILDAGGGTGKWSMYFAKRGFEVSILDVSPAMLEVAVERFKDGEVSDRINIVKGSICDLPYEDNSFDFVFSERNPISHCGKANDAQIAVHELYRVLRTGGYFWGCVLNRLRKVAQMVMELDFERAKAILETGDLPRSATEYTHYFLLEEWMLLLGSVGYIDISIQPATALTEFIPSAWLLGAEPLNKLLTLEQEIRMHKEAAVFGVRFHTLAKK